MAWVKRWNEYIGCRRRPGFYCEKLLENLPNSRVTILDIDDKLLRIAKNRLSNSYYNNRIAFKKTSVYKTGIKDNTYDFVICRFVLQHLDKPVEAVREIYRILKPGGIVAIIDSDSGLMGISDPAFLIKSGRSFFQELEKEQDGIGNRKKVSEDIKRCGLRIWILKL